MNLREWTADRLAKLHPAVLEQVHRDLVEARMKLQSMEEWALDEMANRGIAARCIACKRPIDPTHTRLWRDRRAEGGECGQLHPGCAT